MNSLEELNGYSTDKLIFEDDRPADFGTFVNDGLPTTTVFITEDTNHNLIFGGSFEGLVALDNDTVDHLTLRVDFTNATDPQINWPAAKNNIQFNEPAPGLYDAEFIQTNSDFRYLIENTFVYMKDQEVDFSYTITVSWPGNSHTQTFNAVVTNVPELNNITVSRTYAQNTISNLFPDNFLSLLDNNGTNYTLNLIAPSGYLRFVDDLPPYSSQLSISGNRAEFDAILSSNTIQYIPEGGNINTVSMAYNLLRDSDGIIDSGNFNVSRVGGTALPDLFIDSAISDQIVTDDQHRYFYKCDILIIADGGDGGDINSGVAGGGGGGGAGGLVYYANNNIFQNRTQNTYRTFTNSTTINSNPSRIRTDRFLQENINSSWSDLISVYGGGPGGDFGNDGYAGGNGGGAASGGYTGGTVLFPYIDGYIVGLGAAITVNFPGENSNPGAQSNRGGGNTSLTFDITGTPIQYSAPGPGGGQTVPLLTTLGSGGQGRSNDNSGNLVLPRTLGQPGRVYIKFYTG